MHAFILALVLVIVGTSSADDHGHEIDPQIDIFPPKHKPGEVIKKIKQSDVDYALGEVLKAKTILQTRNVAIGVASRYGRLVNPLFHLKDGVQPATLPPVIETDHTGLILFSKSNIGVKGVYGIVTYDIEGTQLRLAILFSIPFNHVVYSNRYNMKIYSKSTQVDGKLVDQMYNYAGAWTPGAYEKRSEYGVEMEGVMTDNRDSKEIVWVDATNMSLEDGPSRHADCAYKTIVLGNRCWVECDLGTCWTREVCDSIKDCHGKMPCKDKCENLEVEGPDSQK